jgi:DNA-binding IclR family transcriptional regulator
MNCYYSNMEKLPAQPIKGLQDGIIVLQQLANSREPVSSLELSNELGIEKTRVNRILKTLTYLGIAYRTTSRKYSSGPGMHVLAAQSLAASGLFHTSVRHLEDLSVLGHITALGVLWRDKVSYLFHHSPGTPFQEAIGRTQLYPATQSSLGMVLMAQKSDKEIFDLYKNNCIKNRNIKSENYAQNAQKDIPNKNALVHSGKEEIEGFNNIEELLSEICEVRRSGYAAVKNNGGWSIALKIGSPAYAAIGISGNINKNEVNKYVDILQNKALQIEEELKH